MEKIIIIGCSGSGKTTFAEKLAQKTGIELFYLDSVWHKPDRTHISREDFDERLAEILQKEMWIIDGKADDRCRWQMKGGGLWRRRPDRLRPLPVGDKGSNAVGKNTESCEEIYRRSKRTMFLTGNVNGCATNDR